jgi:hypothetical protein
LATTPRTHFLVNCNNNNKIDQTMRETRNYR